MPATTAAQAAAVAQEVIIVDEGSDMDEDVEARPAPQADDVAHPSGSTSQSPTPAPPDYDHAVRTADPTTSPIALSQRFRKFIAEAHEIANIVAKCKPRVVETEHVDLMIDMQEAALLPLRAWWSRTELNDDDWLHVVARVVCVPLHFFFFVCIFSYRVWCLRSSGVPFSNMFLFHFLLPSLALLPFLKSFLSFLFASLILIICIILPPTAALKIN